MKDEPLTEADMTGAERAAWEVAVNRGLNISRADLRALLTAAPIPRTRKLPAHCRVHIEFRSDCDQCVTERTYE